MHNEEELNCYHYGHGDVQDLNKKKHDEEESNSSLLCPKDL
jgi:hypothetical protein